MWCMCAARAPHANATRDGYRRIWPENWVDGGGLGITIRNEPRETVLTSIPISGRGVGNAAGHVKISPKF